MWQHYLSRVINDFFGLISDFETDSEEEDEKEEGKEEEEETGREKQKGNEVAPLQKSGLL